MSVTIPIPFPLPWVLSVLLALSLVPATAGANLPGGGTGVGPDVTVADNGNGTVTMANGIVSIVIVKKTSRLNEVTYTCDRGGKPQTIPMLQGKGQYYYGGFMLGNGAFEYSLATDPTANKGDYADVRLVSESATNGVMETHFSMLRGSPGYYSTAIMTHRKQDAAFEVAPGASSPACRRPLTGSARTTSGTCSSALAPGPARRFPIPPMRSR